VSDNGVYNGMPAGDLPDVHWRAAGGAAGWFPPTGEPGWFPPTGEQSAGVEMAKLPDGQIAVRNSADPDGPALIYTRAEIEALIGGAQDGDFDALLA
jgi:Domain of unknown function (DUF397)